MNYHLYRDYQNLLAWKVIDEAITDLVANNDLQEMTSRDYIVGYLIKQLVEAGATVPEGRERPGNSNE